MIDVAPPHEAHLELDIEAMIPFIGIAIILIGLIVIILILINKKK